MSDIPSINPYKYYFFSALTPRGPVQGTMSTKNKDGTISTLGQLLSNFVAQGAILQLMIEIDPNDHEHLEKVIKEANTSPKLIVPTGMKM